MRFLRGVGPFLLVCLCSLPLAAQRTHIPGAGEGTTTTYSIDGTVRDAATNRAIEDVRVDLRSASGALVGSAVSGFSGGFDISGLGSGEFYVEIRMIGYQPLRQEVMVNGYSVMGLQVMLHPVQQATGGSTQATVSKRELSIPHKAHDAMLKGYRLLYDKSDAKGSLKEFEHATQAYPDYYEAYAQMGVAYIRLGKNDDAEKALRKSEELSKEHYSTAFWLLALLDSNRTRFADAEPLARKAIALDENSWQAKFELSRALFGLNRIDEAETSALAAVTLEPGNGPLRLLLARIHLKMNNYPALLEDLNAFLKIEPKGPMADKARQMRDKVQQALAAAAAAPVTNDPAPKP